jgi:hypothetical protein
MDSPLYSAFVDLDELDRAHWLVRFFDWPSAALRGSDLPNFPTFPTLRAGETADTWLCDQFKQVAQILGKQDRICRSVVLLITTEVRNYQVERRDQILGLLLEVAGACGFAEVAETLRGWARADDYRHASYRLGSETIPLRRTIWSLLIGWNKTEDLIPALRRDLSLRPELGSEALCFRELGRLSPGEAIELIPRIFGWPEPYWREALRAFLTDLGPDEAFSTAYLERWKSCFVKVTENVEPSRVERLLAPRDWGVGGALIEVFAKVGVGCSIEVREPWRQVTLFHLRGSGDSVQGSLRFNVHSPWSRRAVEAQSELYQQDFARAYDAAAAPA